MGSVSVRNVSKDYVLGRTIVRALHDVSLEVERSEFIAIAGPSGSGKSTLLNLVSAIDSPTTGEVLIDGVNLKSLDDNGLSDLRANKIGFIFQTFNLIPVLSAYENVEFPLLFKRGSPVPKARVKEVLARVGLRTSCAIVPTSCREGRGKGWRWLEPSSPTRSSSSPTSRPPISTRKRAKPSST